MSIGGYANWSIISDGRVKKNIKENVPGLSFINRLKPITYNLNLEEGDKITKRSAGPENIKKEEISMQELNAARSKKEAVIYTGFVA